MRNFCLELKVTYFLLSFILYYKQIKCHFGIKPRHTPAVLFALTWIAMLRETTLSHRAINPKLQLLHSKQLFHALNTPTHTTLLSGTRKEFGNLQALGMWELQSKSTVETRETSTEICPGNLQDLHSALSRAIGFGVEQSLQQEQLSRERAQRLGNALGLKAGTEMGSFSCLWVLGNRLELGLQGAQQPLVPLPEGKLGHTDFSQRVTCTSLTEAHFQSQILSLCPWSHNLPMYFWMCILWVFQSTGCHDQLILQCRFRQLNSYRTVLAHWVAFEIPDTHRFFFWRAGICFSFRGYAKAILKIQVLNGQ